MIDIEEEIMSNKIVFYTRTGTSERIAKKIKEKIGGELIQITDNGKWKGLIGYMRAGFYSIKNKDVDIQVHGSIQEEDKLILVAPLWAGGLAVAANVFIRKYGADRIHLVVTSLGSMLKARTGFKSITDIVTKKVDEDHLIEELKQRI